MVIPTYIQVAGLVRELAGWRSQALAESTKATNRSRLRKYLEYCSTIKCQPVPIPVKPPRAELQGWAAKTNKNKNKNPPMGVFSGVGAMLGRHLPGSGTSAQWVTKPVMIMLLCTFRITTVFAISNLSLIELASN